MKKDLLLLPNILSLSRIVFLPLLVFFALQGNVIAFTISYAVLGSTDAFDGYIARKFNMTSDLGKALDSIADLIFYLSTAWFIYILYRAYLVPNMTLLMVFLSLLFLSFVVSFIKCGKPILMHTNILRFNAIMIYILIILSYFMDTTYFIAFILIVYYVGLIEEMLIFIKFGEVDPDTPSIFTLIENSKIKQG